MQSTMELPPLAVLHEQAAMPPSLFEQYANTEVTVFGITGTLSQLTALCPVAHDATKMTREAVDLFAANVLQESGIEIPQEFAHLIPEKPASESPKQTEPEIEKKKEAAKQVAPEPEAAIISAPAEAEPTPPAIVRAATVKPEQVTAKVEEKTLLPSLAPIPDTVPLAIKLPRIEVPAPEHFAPREPLVLRAPSVPLTISERVTTPVLPEIPQIAAIEPAVPKAEFEPVPDAEILTLPEMALVATKTETATTQEHEEDEDIAALLFEQLIERATSIATGESHESALTSETERLDPYEQFTAALFEFAATGAKGDVYEIPLELSVEDEKSEGYLPVETTAPPVCQEVAVRLATLEVQEKKTVTPVVEEIIRLVQEVRALDAVLTSPEQVAVVEERLEELCQELLEILGIAYDEQKIEQFMRSLLDPGFMQQAVQEESPRLWDLGTHERKHFTQFFSGWAQRFSHLSLPHLLGMFTLFWASPKLHADIWAYDET